MPAEPFREPFVSYAIVDGELLPAPPRTSMSPRLLEAFIKGEVTKGGLAEAGWFDHGCIKDGDGPTRA
jgi:hypothetical protein